MKKSQLLKKLNQMKPDVLLDIYFRQWSEGSPVCLGSTVVKELWPSEEVREYYYLETCPYSSRAPMTVEGTKAALNKIDKDVEIKVAAHGHFLDIVRVSKNGRIDC